MLGHRTRSGPAAEDSSSRRHRPHVADRTMVIGDAAGLVKPTTGGGIHYNL
jgi:flavin-dependent dehydrogenase